MGSGTRTERGRHESVTEANLGLITRRRFLQQTAFAARALYGPIQVVARTQTLGDHAQNAAVVDPAAIRKLASRIAGHVITLEAPD